MIKMLALDLDGTLINSKGEVPCRNLQAIRKAEEAGVLVTIATGRRFRDARPVSLYLGLNAPIISHNGALIKNTVDLSIVSASILSADAVAEVLSFGREFGAEAMLSADPAGKGKLYYDNLPVNSPALRSYLAWSRKLHGKDAEDALHHVASLEMIIGEVEAIHISFSGRCEEMARLESSLSKSLGESVSIHATIYPQLDFTLLDILPPGSSKATGLRDLAAIYGIYPEEIMACGDNYNDLEMLRFAGLGVVMGNASSAMRKIAGLESTAANDEDGVALAIEKFILK